MTANNFRTRLKLPAFTPGHVSMAASPDFPDTVRFYVFRDSPYLEGDAQFETKKPLDKIRANVTEVLAGMVGEDFVIVYDALVLACAELDAWKADL